MPERRGCAGCVRSVKSARPRRNSRWLSSKSRVEQRLQPERFGEGEGGEGEGER